jgi:hypothetical protein
VPKNFPILSSNQRLSEVFTAAPMAAFWRLPNICEQLVKSGRESQKLDHTMKCDDGRCCCCHLFTEETQLDINGTKFMPVECGIYKSTNTIYTIRCNKFNLSYVWETTQALSLRISGHRTAINRVKKGATIDDESNDNGTAYHFGNGGHNFKKYAEVAISEVGS